MRLGNGKVDFCCAAAAAAAIAPHATVYQGLVNKLGMALLQAKIIPFTYWMHIDIASTVG